MVRGNFRIDDAPQGRRELGAWDAFDGGVRFDGARIEWDGPALTVTCDDPSSDRMYFRFHAEPEESVWGGGEQMSYFSLNGRRFPMWTSEPGVGRDKSTKLTQTMADKGMVVGQLSEKLAGELHAIGQTMTEEWLKKAGADGQKLLDTYRQP